jgi:hypothetical protein
MVPIRLDRVTRRVQAGRVSVFNPVRTGTSQRGSPWGRSSSSQHPQKTVRQLGQR